MPLALIIPSFFAGLLTFLAPCTLPLVPAYLGFISGTPVTELSDPTKAHLYRRKVFINGFLFIVGFSFIFIGLGVLFGLGGAALIQYRGVLSRIGGVFVMFFGLYMTGFLRLRMFSFLTYERKIRFSKHLTPGNPTSSLLFGATFAFGWTPCVGPILGSVLTLAATSATVGQGAVLLLVFSLGLAIPFLIIAAGAGTALVYIKKLNRYIEAISRVGGVLLFILGLLLVTDQYGLFAGYIYRWFNILNYDALLQYL